jgi:hypothetical protein
MEKKRMKLITGPIHTKTPRPSAPTYVGSFSQEEKALPKEGSLFFETEVFYDVYLTPYAHGSGGGILLLYGPAAGPVERIKWPSAVEFFTHNYRDEEHLGIKPYYNGVKALIRACCSLELSLRQQQIFLVQAMCENRGVYNVIVSTYTKELAVMTAQSDYDDLGSDEKPKLLENPGWKAYDVPASDPVKSCWVDELEDDE